MNHRSLLVLALVLGCAATQGSGRAATKAPLAPAECGSIEHLHALGDVWLASQPSPADFECARDAGVRTVIDLRPAGELSEFDEPALVRGLGLAYVSLPFKSPETLTDEVFDRARELLDTAEGPILLHCSSANRVGAVWLPWRVLDGGLGWDAALAEARTIGLRTPAYEEKARSYVERQRP